MDIILEKTFRITVRSQDTKPVPLFGNVTYKYYIKIKW